MAIVGLYILSYLVGAVPTAYLIGRLAKGIDLRRYGSGNVGGTNLFYHIGKGWLVPLGFFEIFLKGASPIWIGQYLLGMELPWPLHVGTSHYLLGREQPSAVLLVAPLLAIAGNNWSAYLKFQGGRGIAVVSGTLLALSPQLLLAFIAVALAGWVLTRSSAVWVLISLALLPLWTYVSGEPGVVTWYCGGVLALVVLKRLLSNWTPFPAGLPRKKVLFNRLFRDRDLDDRDQWVKRVSRGPDNN